MAMGRIKIVLDADVVIDFKEADRLFILPKILPDYDFVILDIMKNSGNGIQQKTTFSNI